jgi:hypothetical protein
MFIKFSGLKKLGMIQKYEVAKENMAMRMG